MMTFLKTASLASVAAVVLATSAFAATAPATSRDCMKKGREVTTALNDTSASDTTDAKRERMLGYSFCQAGNYDAGVAHFAKAAELLGQKQASR